MRGFAEGGPDRIVPGTPMDNLNFSEPRRIIDGDFESEFETTPGDPLRTSFRALVDIYRHFGIGPEEVPFVSNESIDPSAIRHIRS